MIIDFDKLKIMQARAGLTLLELGVSKSTITRIRAGKPIQPTTLHKLAAALQCDPADLIKGGDVI